MADDETVDGTDEGTDDEASADSEAGRDYDAECRDGLEPAISIGEYLECIESGAVMARPGDILCVRKEQCIGRLLAAIDVDDGGHPACYHHTAVYLGRRRGDDLVSPQDGQTVYTLASDRARQAFEHLADGDHGIAHVSATKSPCPRVDGLAAAMEDEKWVQVLVLRVEDDERASVVERAVALLTTEDGRFAAIETFMVPALLLWTALRWEEIDDPDLQRAGMIHQAAAMTMVFRNAGLGLDISDGDGVLTCSKMVARCLSDDSRESLISSAASRRVPVADAASDEGGLLDFVAALDHRELEIEARAIVEAFEAAAADAEDFEAQALTLLARVDRLCGEDGAPLSAAEAAAMSAIVLTIARRLGPEGSDAPLTGADLTDNRVDVAAELARQAAELDSNEYAEELRALYVGFITPGDLERADGLFDRDEAVCIDPAPQTPPGGVVADPLHHADLDGIGSPAGGGRIGAS